MLNTNLIKCCRLSVSFVIIGLILSASPASHAQQGILPGEMDPSQGAKIHKSEGDKERDIHDNALLDDRKPCPKGQKRYPKMKCGQTTDAEPECQNYSPVLECHDKHPATLDCKKPQIPVPVYRCEP
jgi:hypothetical protein